MCDTKGELLGAASASLERKGYRICHLDFTDCARSTHGYNPIDAIRRSPKAGTYNAQDALKLAAAIVPIEYNSDPFWDFAARQYLAAILGYMLEALPEAEHTLPIAHTLLAEMATGNFRKLMDEHTGENPLGFAARQYRLIRGNAAAEKMDASIRGILGEKLGPFAFPGAGRLYGRSSKVDFHSLRKEPTAVFVSVSDTDRSVDRLASLFYTQALQALCAEPVPEDGEFLPVQVYIDDFASGVKVPEFDSVSSVTRSRHIGLSILLQSVTQLESLYGVPASKTILNNFDHMLYLGGTDVDTCRYIGIRADRGTQSVLSMPCGEAWLFERGKAARRVEKCSTGHMACAEPPAQEKKGGRDHGNLHL